MCIKTSVTPPRLSFICFVGKQQDFKDFNPQNYNAPNKNKERFSPGASSRDEILPFQKELNKYFPLGADTASLSTR